MTQSYPLTQFVPGKWVTGLVGRSLLLVHQLLGTVERKVDV
jgi:hypothetical protein